MTTAELLSASPAQLRRLLEHGHPIDPHALDDRTYRGTSLGLPHFIERLTWKKFKKTFHRDPQTGALRGWNVRCEQNDLDLPWIARRDRHGQPVTFGPYEVVPARGVQMPAAVGHGLLIHYGCAGNGLPLSRLRDPIVALREGDAARLLGWSYLDLGITRVGTPSFFLLEDDGPLD